MNHTNISLLFIIIHLVILLLFMVYSLKKGWLNLDHRSLFVQKLFWISILIPFSSFLLYGTWAWLGHTPDLSARGFETFYNISKIPLLLLAASVPLASIVNNIHRTIQTEKQIKEAEKKNIADSYYSHFKNTLDLFKNIKSKDLTIGTGDETFNLYINNPVSLYNTIYENSSHQKGPNYQASESFKNTIKSDWRKIKKALEKLWPLLIKEKGNASLRDQHKILINLYKLEAAFERICENLLLGSLSQENRPIFRTNRGYYIGLFYSSSALTTAIRELDSICLKIFDIILSPEEDNEKIHPSYFLEKNVFIKFNSILPLRRGSNVLLKKVSLRIERSGD